MLKKENNFAFIDSQNLIMGIQELGWKLDFKRFRVYLREKYSIQVAYLFIGYLPENQNLYRSLQKKGYVLIFKEVLQTKEGRVKGNCDAELVLQSMIDYHEYDKALIISSDGDFACLVRHLMQENKLLGVLSPHHRLCSFLLRKAAKGKIRCIFLIH